MPIRVSNLRIGLDDPPEALSSRLLKLHGGSQELPWEWRILRKSLDFRDWAHPHYVFTILIDTPAEEEAALLGNARRLSAQARVDSYREPEFVIPEPGSRPLSNPPVIVGSGPAGLFAGLLLSELGYYPSVIERGKAVNERIRDVHEFDSGGSLDPESNYLFGEGGAGTFSDGKLTCRGTGPDVRRVLEIFAAHKGKPSVIFDARPHLGSNRLPAVVKALRRRIISLGGTIHFGCKADDIDIRDGKLCGLYTSTGLIAAQVVIFATGHSARDTYAMLLGRGVPLMQKPFQLGVRIEQPQETVNRFQYGPRHLEDKIGAADYALVARGKTDLFTFCMCAGGHIIPSVSAPGFFGTNGMSLSNRDSPFANSGLMVTIGVEQFPGRDVMAGIRMQETFERCAFETGKREYACPIQSVADFVNQRQPGNPPACSYRRERVPAQIAELIPSFVVEALHKGLPMMDRRWRGKFLENAAIVGPESRGSAPVRIVRDPMTLETPGIEGIYPVGEGAGYAGGIVSAAVDGLRAAKAIISKYAPLRR